MAPAKVDVFVDLVRHYENTGVFAQHSRQAFELFLAVDRSARVAGRGKPEHLGFGGDGGPQLVGRHLEVGLDACGNLYRHALGQLHDIAVTHPVGGRKDHLVSLVDHHHGHVGQRLLCPGRDHDLVGGVFQVVVAQEFPGDGFLQVSVSVNRGIAAVVVVDGLFGRLLDKVGDVEVGLAQAQADDVFSRLPEFPGFGGHSEGGRRFHVDDPFGEVLVHIGALGLL